ncbi:MAG: tRNA uridine-5-carboxymethylaminomethyl(34) synthesis GTPase MnmE, partial [Rikenellaceae bacterium]
MCGCEDIIVAPATLSGGAIAIVRVSGDGAIALVDGLFRPCRGEGLADARGYTLHYGEIVDGESVIDDVMISLFRAPRSYTSEDSVEISSHGSAYIVQRIIELIISRGARLASAGEFTTRAFLAGRIDLSQAEAVADMIASTSRATHAMATTQMRGGYSDKLSSMRAELVHLGALLELELDFSEEDVEFADRSELKRLMEALKMEVEQLRESFKVGNAIKEGVAVAIVGAPNAGKSTLLNRILGEDRAMVSDVAGTTRDSIEETINIDGVTFRFIDTAGLHKTDDKLEKMGIERTYSAISRANIIVQLVDIEDINNVDQVDIEPHQELIIVINKVDLGTVDMGKDHLYISAKNGDGIENLLQELRKRIDLEGLYKGDIIVSNTRHYTHLNDANNSLKSAINALDSNLPTDLLAEDLRHTLHHIGAITGEITNNEILAKIFSSFCI